MITIFEKYTEIPIIEPIKYNEDFNEIIKMMDIIFPDTSDDNWHREYLDAVDKNIFKNNKQEQDISDMMERKIMMFEHYGTENLDISLKYVTDGLFDFLKESLPNVKFYISKKYNDFTGYYEYSIRYYKNNKAPDIDDIIRDNHSLTVIKIHKSSNTVAIRIYPDKVGESLSRLDKILYKYVMGIFNEVDWENTIDNERYKNFFTYKFETLKSLINKLNVDDYKMMKTANKYNI